MCECGFPLDSLVPAIYLGGAPTWSIKTRKNKKKHTMAWPEKAFYSSPVIMASASGALPRWFVAQRASIVRHLIWLILATFIGPIAALAGFVTLTLGRMPAAALLAQMTGVGVVESLAELRSVGAEQWRSARRAGTTVTVAAALYLAIDSALLSAGAQVPPPVVACIVRICAAHILTGAECEPGGFPVFIPQRSTRTSASVARAIWTGAACVAAVALPTYAPTASIVDAAARAAFCGAWWQSVHGGCAHRVIAATSHLGFMTWLCLEAYAPYSALPVVAVAGGRMLHQLALLFIALDVTLARERAPPPAFA